MLSYKSVIKKLACVPLAFLELIPGQPISRILSSGGGEFTPLEASSSPTA